MGPTVLMKYPLSIQGDRGSQGERGMKGAKGDLGDPGFPGAAVCKKNRLCSAYDIQ